MLVLRTLGRRGWHLRGLRDLHGGVDLAGSLRRIVLEVALLLIVDVLLQGLPGRLLQGEVPELQILGQ